MISPLHLFPICLIADRKMVKTQVQSHCLLLKTFHDFPLLLGKRPQSLAWPSRLGSADPPTTPVSSEVTFSSFSFFLTLEHVIFFLCGALFLRLAHSLLPLSDFANLAKCHSLGKPSHFPFAPRKPVFLLAISQHSAFPSWEEPWFSMYALTCVIYLVTSYLLYQSKNCQVKNHLPFVHNFGSFLCLTLAVLKEWVNLSKFIIFPQPSL